MCSTLVVNYHTLYCFQDLTMIVSSSDSELSDCVEVISVSKVNSKVLMYLTPNLLAQEHTCPALQHNDGSLSM